MELSPSSNRILSIQERLELIQALNGMPLSQILELEVALNIPPAIMPGLSEALGIRNKALLGWVEGPTGVGLAKFLDVLEEATGFALDRQSGRLDVLIEVSIHEADAGSLLAALKEVQAKANAPTTVIVKVLPGSIRLRLQGSPEELERLKQMIDSGNLVELAGWRIISAQVSLDLSEANLNGADLNEAALSGANLRAANLNRVDLSRANLSRADLRDASLIEADLSGADLDAANLSRANLRSSTLRGANLRRATLEGANLRNASLIRVALCDANLQAASLHGARLIEADLSGANLRDATLIDAKLIEANLSRANFTEADLSGANFSYATLAETRLIDADLRGANLNEADLRGAILRASDLRAANVVQAANVAGAIFGDNPGLPEEERAILRSRGAIFRDTPGSNAPVGV